MNWTGYTLWARQTLESDVFKTKPDKWFKIFFFLVMRANHKDNEQWKRGDAHTSYAEIVEYTGANKNEIDHCIRWLKDRRMLATRKATRGFHFTIIKYGQYQDSSNYKATPKAIEKRHRSDTIKNNDKNDKKDSISTSVSDETNDVVSSKELEYVSDLEEYKKPKRATRQKPENRKLSMKLIDHLKHIKKMTVPDGRFEEDNIYQCASLVNKIKATLLAEKREQTEEEILKLFDYIMNKLSDWHWEKATSIKYISNNYYRIYEEIKNGKSK